jgi:hypothetical protein
MPGCAASGAIGGQHWAECATVHDPETRLTRRFVVCSGYVVGVYLCPMHTRLWDSDYGHVAVWAGAPVADSSVSR